VRPAHVTGLFQDKLDAIETRGEIEVSLAGRPFRIRRAFLKDIAEQNLVEHIASLRKALLIFYSPTDEVVSIENASHIFAAAKHPKSFVSLADADHLLSRRTDAIYVANVIAAWAERYLDMSDVHAETAGGEPGTVVVRETRKGVFQQEITVGAHRLLADEPLAVGGLDSGAGPYDLLLAGLDDLLLAGLGACTSMTLRLYANRKGLPLDRVTVRLNHARIHAVDREDCETKEGIIHRVERVISLQGDLDAVQRARLLEIAKQMPSSSDSDFRDRHQDGRRNNGT
jgi:uncharacterized OsmC-like protein